MKNSKKIVALVLAMVMIFALTASALAATNATGVTVRVTIKGVINKPTGTDPNATETETLCTAKSITITTGDKKNTVYDLVNTLNALHSDYAFEPVWKPVALKDADGNLTNKTAQALVSLSNKVATASTSEYPNITINTWSSNGKTVKTYSDGVFPAYNCVYTGYDWIYKVNNETIEDQYMDQYVLSNGDLVELVYQYNAEAWNEIITG